MIEELLYTSHRGKGLRQGGGGGFCTVVATQGMNTGLAQALERLSGYKHPFDIHDPRARHNPVNYRFARIHVSGRSYHVLSRIADLPVEHTGRSNKLAHHVAFSEKRLPLGGPAHVMARPDFFRTTWNGYVESVAARTLASCARDEPISAPCAAWERVAGDAGWAGYVAELLTQRGSSNVSIVYPLGTDPLLLVQEVFRLIPAEQRWMVPFSTYFTTLPAGTSCALRWFMNGTIEAEQLKRDRRQLTLDLTATPSTLPNSKLVEAARAGTPVGPTDSPKVFASPLPQPAAIERSQPAASSIRLETEVQAAADDMRTRELLRIEPPDPEPNVRPSAQAELRCDAPAANGRLSASVGLAALLLLMFVGFGVAVGAFAGGVLYLSQTGRDKSIAGNDSAARPLGTRTEWDDRGQPESPVDDSNADAVRCPDHAAGTDAQPAEASQTRPASSGNDESNIQGEHHSSGRNASATDARDGDANRGRAEGSASDGSNKPSYDSLPDEFLIPSLESGWTQEHASARYPLGASTGAITSLELIGLDSLQVTPRRGGESRFLKRQAMQLYRLTDRQQWEVQRYTLTATDEVAEVAVLRRDQQELIFEWRERSTKDFERKLAASLRWCVLKLEFEDGGQKHIRLTEPMIPRQTMLEFPGDPKALVRIDLQELNAEQLENALHFSHGRTLPRATCLTIDVQPTPANSPADRLHVVTHSGEGTPYFTVRMTRSVPDGEGVEGPVASEVSESCSTESFDEANFDLLRISVALEGRTASSRPNDQYIFLRLKIELNGLLSGDGNEQEWVDLAGESAQRAIRSWRQDPESAHRSLTKADRQLNHRRMACLEALRLCSGHSGRPPLSFAVKIRANYLDDGTQHTLTILQDAAYQEDASR